MPATLVRTNINSMSKHMRTRSTFAWDPLLALYTPLWDETNGATFVSKDGGGRVCTNTGTTWGMQGRTYNGIGDYTDCGLLNPAGAFTVIVWVKRLGNGTGQDKWMVGNRHYVNAGDSKGFWLGEYWNVVPYVVFGCCNNALVYAGFDHTNPLWSIYNNIGTHIAGVFDGATVKLVINGILNDSQATPFATVRASDYNLLFAKHTEVANYVNAIIGEVRVELRAFAISELQNDMLKTQWRYRV